MSGKESVHSPCSRGWPLTAVAFILRASLADVSQCEPLLVSWSLSAWSLSPWPLSRRLARSASLNVELQQKERRENKHNSLLLPCECSYLTSIVSLLDIEMNVNALVRKLLVRALTFEQMAACCQHNWALRENYPSENERKKLLCIGHLKMSLLFFSPHKSLRNMICRLRKQCSGLHFRFLHFNRNT